MLDTEPSASCGMMSLVVTRSRVLLTRRDPYGSCGPGL